NDGMAASEKLKPNVATRMLIRFGKACAWVASLALILFLYVLEVRREDQRLAPPAGVTDFMAFSKRMSLPKRLAVVEHGGSEYIVWHGELAGPLAIPSGQSCYLFKGTGELIDWQPETGEGGRIDQFLQS